MERKGLIRYDDVRGQIEGKGIRKIQIGDQVREFRSHSIPDEEVERLVSVWKETGEFQSPYTKSVRTDQLLALARLGLNEAWSLAEIKRVLRPLMSDSSHVMKCGETRWSRFEKSQRGVNSKDVTDRILDNYRALQRLCRERGSNPYGYKLRQIGCAIEIFTEVIQESVDGKTHRAVKKYIRLNTYSSEPVSMRVSSRDAIPPVNRNGPTMGPRI